MSNQLYWCENCGTSVESPICPLCLCDCRELEDDQCPECGRYFGECICNEEVEDEDEDEPEDNDYICQRCGRDVRNCTCDEEAKDESEDSDYICQRCGRDVRDCTCDRGRTW